jgi:hypothetical protein
MIRPALILALLVPLTSTYRPQYIPAGPHFPVGAIINPCLVAAYPMNEGSGLTLNDTSPGGTNTATLAATGHTWQSNAGLPGTTLLFTGGAGILGATASSATPTSFSNTHAFSVMFWYNITSGVAAQFLLSTRDTAGTNQGWAILNAPGIAGSTILQFSLVGTSAGNNLNVQINNAVAPTSGVIHQAAMVYTGSSTAAGVQWYVDGSPKSMNTNTDALSTTSANSIPLNFAQENNGTNKLAGVLAFVGVYNCAITSGFVASSSTSGPGIY